MTSSDSSHLTNDASNVDSDEIARFEQLAHRWWDPEGDFKPLHDMNPLRADFINERSPVNTKKVIDIGCGGGILTESLAKKGAVITGIDMGKAPLNIAKLHAMESGLEINYRQITAEAIAEEQAEQYDVITCLEMLEHVPSPASVISSCAKLCKPGGNLYFSTINRNPKAWLMAIVGAEYILGLLPKGTHEYQKLIKPSELCQWLRDNHLQLQTIKGMLYEPFSKTFRLDGNDVGVNYLIHATKPN